MTTYTYVPPTEVKRPRPEISPSAPERFFPQEYNEVTVGISVLKESGTWVQRRNPSQSDLDAADDFFVGGYTYTGVAEATKTEIEGDGVGGTFTAE